MRREISATETERRAYCGRGLCLDASNLAIDGRHDKLKNAGTNLVSWNQGFPFFLPPLWSFLPCGYTRDPYQSVKFSVNHNSMQKSLLLTLSSCIVMTAYHIRFRQSSQYVEMIPTHAHLIGQPSREAMIFPNWATSPPSASVAPLNSRRRAPCMNGPCARALSSRRVRQRILFDVSTNASFLP